MAHPLQLLLDRDFTLACNTHVSQTGNARKANLLCWDCRVGPMCSECESTNHNGHICIQVYISKHQPTLKLKELKHVLDVEYYVFSFEDHVFLRQPESKVPLCEVCNYRVQSPFRYCSLSCKLQALRNLQLIQNGTNFQEVFAGTSECRQPGRNPMLGMEEIRTSNPGQSRPLPHEKGKGLAGVSDFIGHPFESVHGFESGHGFEEYGKPFELQAPRNLQIIWNGTNFQEVFAGTSECRQPDLNPMLGMEEIRTSNPGQSRPLPQEKGKGLAGVSDFIGHPFESGHGFEEYGKPFEVQAPRNLQLVQNGTNFQEVFAGTSECRQPDLNPMLGMEEIRTSNPGQSRPLPQKHNNL